MFLLPSVEFPEPAYVVMDKVSMHFSSLFPVLRPWPVLSGGFASAVFDLQNSTRPAEKSLDLIYKTCLKLTAEALP